LLVNFFDFYLLESLVLVTHLQKLAFNQEVSLMQFFADSDYVAKLVGYSTTPLCLVMKYYSLGSLDSWLERDSGSITKKVMNGIVRDISRGLFVLHQRQVAHCDIKPQNVLVEMKEEKFRCVLTDFGISKILTNEYLASEAFQIRNLRGLTVPYAAPDALARFRKKNVIGTPEEEKAGDVYSFGIVIYYILTIKNAWN
jgi:serine/threonine protein kinase